MDMGIRRTLACALAAATTTAVLTTPAPTEAASARPAAGTHVAHAAAAEPAPLARDERGAKPRWTSQTPQLTGPKKVNTTLHIKFAWRNGFTPKADKLYFQWRRWNEPIPGAAGPDYRRYQVQPRDRNANIVCVVFGSKGGRTGFVKSNVVKIART